MKKTARPVTRLEAPEPRIAPRRAPAEAVAPSRSPCVATSTARPVIASVPFAMLPFRASRRRSCSSSLVSTCPIQGSSSIALPRPSAGPDEDRARALAPGVEAEANAVGLVAADRVPARPHDLDDDLDVLTAVGGEEAGRRAGAKP